MIALIKRITTFKITRHFVGTWLQAHGILGRHKEAHGCLLLIFKAFALEFETFILSYKIEDVT